MGSKRILRDAGVVVAATIGAGIFALPYIFLQSGFWLGAFYLLILGAIIIYSHILYWRVLDLEGGNRHLLDLAETFFGPVGYFLGVASIIFGLLLISVVYLLLGSRLLQTFLPSLGESYGLMLFWAFTAMPLLFKDKKIILLESLGSFAMAAIIVFIFASSGFLKIPSAPALSFRSIFLPFGALLFSLAGWTAIEPLHAAHKNKESDTYSWRLPLFLGTVFSGVLYLMFVSGIFAGAPRVTPDTISGFLGSAGPKKFILAILGIFAIWTSYESINLEIKNTLVRDFKFKPFLGSAFVVLAPIFLILLGFNGFSRIVGLAGGVFLSLQYLLILFISHRALHLKKFQTLAVSLASLVFVLGMIYEIYYFVVL